jgi:hypothetical protein
MAKALDCSFDSSRNFYHLSRTLESAPDATQPPDPGRELVESVRLSFWVDVGGQGPVSGAPA